MRFAAGDDRSSAGQRIGPCRNALLGVLLVLLAGCADQVARSLCEKSRRPDPVAIATSQMGAGQMGRFTDVRQPMALDFTMDEEPPTGVRPRVVTIPGGRVAIGVIEPSQAPYTMTWFAVDGDERAIPTLPDGHGPCMPAPRGTVLILHGWNQTMYDSLGWATAAANLGLRSIVVDLAIFTAEPWERTTFGPAERRLVRELLAELHRDGTLKGPVALWGYSMGAAIALAVAAEEPSLAGVIAVGPYARLHDALEAGRGEVPWYQRWWLSTTAVERAVTARTGRTPADEPVATLPKITIPVLLIAGADDPYAPPSAITALGRLAPHATVTVVPESHQALPWTALEPAATWLTEQVAGAVLLAPWRCDGAGLPIPALATSEERGSYLAACHPGDEPITWVTDGALPLRWWGHDILVELGPIIAGGVQVSWAGIPLACTGAVNDSAGVHVVIPGWLAMGHQSLRLTLSGGEPYRRVIGRLLGRGVARLARDP